MNEARLTEMYLAVDDAGENMQSAAIRALAGIRSAQIADFSDSAVHNSEVARPDPVVVGDDAAGKNHIENPRHVATHLARERLKPQVSYVWGDGKTLKMSEGATYLEDRGILRIDGDDSEAFLQGLVTNDVRRMSTGEARFAALLSPQGKVEFDFLIVRTAESYLLDCVRASASALVRRLSLFRLRSRVRFSDESDSLGVVASWGHESSHFSAHAVFYEPRVVDLGLRTILPTADAASLGTSDLRAYNRRRIDLGVPLGGVDFDYADVFPHDVNMDVLGGVSFSKGCYIGQEVVARMKHRGNTRKRIRRVRFSDAVPPVGAGVMAGGKLVGRMGSSVDGAGLALLRIDRLTTEIRVFAGDTELWVDEPLSPEL